MGAFAMFHVPPQRKKREFRNREGLSLNFTDAELRERYRFGRESIMFLVELLRNDLKRETKRNKAMTVEQQVLITLRFLASGSFLQVVGDTLGQNKGTVSRIIHNTIAALCRKAGDFIKWPNSDAERNKIKSDFFRIGGFPNVIGAIDGTHVKIQSPPGNDDASFVNRKGYHSINVQGVCDGEGRFTNINATCPGSSHDAHIFRTSQVCGHMETVRPLEYGLLLGDSGYPCKPFIMTPYGNPSTPGQASFNRHHSTSRSIIERAFGRLKRRFHVLHSEIRMEPAKACTITSACAILHNFALSRNEPDVGNVEFVFNDAGDDEATGIQDGRKLRDYLTQLYFTH